MSHCIYPGLHSEDFVPEHYLPVALGRFKGLDALYDRVCRRCNQEIGSRVETQFARAGPTGFFRWFIGVKGRAGMPPSPFIMAQVEPSHCIWSEDYLNCHS